MSSDVATNKHRGTRNIAPWLCPEAKLEKFVDEGVMVAANAFAVVDDHL